MEEYFMKKFVVVLAIIALVATSVWAGGKPDKGKSSGGGAEPFIVDLSTLTSLVKNDPKASTEDMVKGAYETSSSLKNAAAFNGGYQDLLIFLPASSVPSDFSKYTRVTITCRYFNAAGDELPQADSMCMVVVAYDAKGDIRGPAMAPGPNTPVKEFNVGGFSGLIQKDKGIRTSFSKPPQAVLFQNNSGSPVAFIEMTGLIFHNGDYEAQ
jgi:hypothetical protein